VVNLRFWGRNEDFSKKRSHKENWISVNQIWFGTKRIWFETNRIWFAINRIRFGTFQIWYALNQIRYEANEVWFALIQIRFAMNRIWYALNQIWFGTNQIQYAANSSVCWQIKLIPRTSKSPIRQIRPNLGHIKYGLVRVITRQDKSNPDKEISVQKKRLLRNDDRPLNRVFCSA